MHQHTFEANETNINQLCYLMSNQIIDCFKLNDVEINAKHNYH